MGRVRVWAMVRSSGRVRVRIRVTVRVRVRRPRPVTDLVLGATATRVRVRIRVTVRVRIRVTVRVRVRRPRPGHRPGVRCHGDTGPALPRRPPPGIIQEGASTQSLAPEQEHVGIGRLTSRTQGEAAAGTRGLWDMGGRGGGLGVK